MWKLATLVLGASTLVLAIMAVHAHRGFAGPAAPGEARGDARGAKDLAAKQIVLGPRAIAEVSKKAQLGDKQAAARDTAKAQRQG